MTACHSTIDLAAPPAVDDALPPNPASTAPNLIPNDGVSHKSAQNLILGTLRSPPAAASVWAGSSYRPVWAHAVPREGESSLAYVIQGINITWLCSETRKSKPEAVESRWALPGPAHGPHRSEAEKLCGSVPNCGAGGYILQVIVL